MGNSKSVLIISLAVCLGFVLCNPIQLTFADLGKIKELDKLKEIAQKKASEYLKNVGPKSGYGKLNFTTTNGTAKNVKADLEKAKEASKENAVKYLKTIDTTTKNLKAKASYGYGNFTSTNETRKNVQDEIEKAKQASEEKAKELLKKLFPNLFPKLVPAK